MHKERAKVTAPTESQLSNLGYTQELVAMTLWVSDWASVEARVRADAWRTHWAHPNDLQFAWDLQGSYPPYQHKLIDRHRLPGIILHSVRAYMYEWRRMCSSKSQNLRFGSWMDKLSLHSLWDAAYPTTDGALHNPIRADGHVSRERACTRKLNRLNIN